MEQATLTKAQVEMLKSLAKTEQSFNIMLLALKATIPHHDKYWFDLAHTYFKQAFSASRNACSVVTRVSKIENLDQTDKTTDENRGANVDVGSTSPASRGSEEPN